jgi:hypothetical protein
MEFKTENRTFGGDIKIIFEALKNKENFAFSKSADGEMRIMQGDNIDLLAKANGEFKYDKNDETDTKYRDKLIEAFQYQAPNYFVSVGCPCCVGSNNYNWMKEFSKQDEESITWANVFVNGNYRFYVDNFIPEYSNHKVIFVCNHKAKINNLFKDNLVKDFRVGTNAWKNDYGLIEEMKQYINNNDIENHLLLFAAGPFGNILIYELFKHNPNNIYLDIGSTLDPMIGLGGTRGYHLGAQTLNKVCTW